MTTVLDDRSVRHARARAIAASIVDAPAAPRRWHIPEELEPSPRRRLTGRGQVVPVRPPRRWAVRRGSGRRNLFVAGVVAVQVAALVLALTLPQLRLHGIDVTGNRLLSSDTIIRASGLGDHQSIFTVDGDGVRARVATLPWVKSVAVETSLPAGVHITVTERTPALRVLRTNSDLLVSADGATLDLGSAVASAVPAGLPALADDRPVTDTSAPPPPGGDLLRVLADTAARFPAVFGCTVSAFRWQSDGILTIVATPGWRAVLGSVSSAADVALIPTQLAALVALKAKVDLVHPTFGYVDLENPSAPVIGGKPGAPEPVPGAATQPSTPGHSDTSAAGAPPATRTPAPAAAAAPAPAATAGPATSPTTRPAPTAAAVPRTPAATAPTAIPLPVRR
ncbi:MAG TPA: FtsQ-type POTRA domain-containing protein [Candidatus Dormibacteraeota bacterium]|nr:FtsQ-type POTRA domain-containing protein [Candidatus Dormibacteraeota bacterium]